MSNYLYNGVELPAIPETDYQYAIIIYHTNTYEVYLSNQQFATTNYRKDNLSLVDYGAYTKYTLNNDEWGEPYNSVSSSGGGIFSSSALNEECFIWANHDFYYKFITGSPELLLQASDPIPTGGADETWQIQKSTVVGIADYFRSKTGKTDKISVTAEAFSVEIDAVYAKGFEEGQDSVVIPEPCATTALDFANWDNGTFVETLSDGSTVTHAVTLENGVPTKVDDIVISGVS